jgi:hypothetical protein
MFGIRERATRTVDDSKAAEPQPKSESDGITFYSSSMWPLPSRIGPKRRRAEGSCSFFASLRLGGQPSPPFRFFQLHNLLSFNRFRAIFFSCTKMIDSSIEESKLVFRSRRRSRQPIFPWKRHLSANQYISKPFRRTGCTGTSNAARWIPPAESPSPTKPFRRTGCTGTSNAARWISLLERFRSRPEA